MGVDQSLFSTFYREGDTRLARWWSIDPKSESFPAFSPYLFMDGNPIKNNDPKGDCPNCIFGFIVGAGTDYIFQVVENYANGDPDPWTDVDLTSIVISGAAGAATSGASALYAAPTKTVVQKTVIKVTTEVVIDGAESTAKQYNETGSVDAGQLLFDVTVGQVTGAATDKIVPKKNYINTPLLENQADRATRLAGDNARPSRVEAAKDLNNKVAAGKATNFVINEAKENTTKNLLDGLFEFKPNDVVDSSGKSNKSSVASTTSTAKKTIPEFYIPKKQN